MKRVEIVFLLLIACIGAVGIRLHGTSSPTVRTVTQGRIIRVHHARIKVINRTGTHISCSAGEQRLIFVVNDESKRAKLHPGNSYFVDYACAMHDDGTHVYTIGKIYAD